MPRRMLSGSLEEQCAFLFDLAQEKMAVGNYSGAIHALKEIRKHAPDYSGVAELLEQARRGKREQALLVWFGFGGAILALLLASLWELPNDLWRLGVVLAGTVVGYLAGIAVVRVMRARASAAGEPATGDATAGEPATGADAEVDAGADDNPLSPDDRESGDEVE